MSMSRCYHNGKIVIKQRLEATRGPSRRFTETHVKLYKACADCGCDMGSAAGRFGKRHDTSLGTIGAKR